MLGLCFALCATRDDVNVLVTNVPAHSTLNQTGVPALRILSVSARYTFGFLVLNHAFHALLMLCSIFTFWS